jgi:hypothetical protein
MPPWNGRATPSLSIFLDGLQVGLEDREAPLKLSQQTL